MFCTNCDNSKALKGKKIVHKYDESGLDNVKLEGVVEYRCSKCGEVYHQLHNIAQLHQLITNILLTKEGRLTGREIRFLRTHIGYSSAYFAKVLGIERETLSRAENQNKVSRALDKHVREAVFNKDPDRRYDLHDAIINQPTKTGKPMTLKSKKDVWLPSFSIDPNVLEASLV